MDGREANVVFVHVNRETRRSLEFFGERRVKDLMILTLCRPRVEGGVRGETQCVNGESTLKRRDIYMFISVMSGKPDDIFQKTLTVGTERIVSI